MLLLFSAKYLPAQKTSKDTLLIEIYNQRNLGLQNIQTEAYVDLINELAKHYRYRNADSLRILSAEAYKISTNIKYQKGKVYALLRKGDFYTDTGLEVKSFEVYNEAKDLAFQLNFPKLQVEVLKSLATQEYMSQNLSQAVLISYQAIELARKNKLYELEARLRHNLGYTYSNYKLYEEAQIEYIITDSLWGKVMGDSHLQGMTLSNIALNAIISGDLDTGRMYSDRSYELLKKSKEPLWLSRALRIKARYHLKNEEYQIALEWILKSDSIIQEVSNPRDQMEINIIHSKILTKLRDLESAKKYSNKALKKALEFKDSIFILQSYEHLEKIHELENEPLNAYNYHLKSEEINALIKKDDQVQNIALLRAKMNFEKEKEAIKFKNLEKSSKQQKYLQWILGVLLTTVMVAIILYKSSRREKNLNKRLEEKKDFLIAHQKQLRLTNANQKTLFSIVGHDLKGPILSLRELLKLMKSEEDKEILLETLLPKLNKYTDHVHFTLDNLLDWGKNQINGENISPSNLVLNEIASNTINLYAEQISKKAQTVDLYIDKETTVWADKEDINAVFRNLLSNAIKFTPINGSIKITVKLKTSGVVIAFKDSGVGMSAETQKLVCDAQTHFSSHGTNNEKGTGLGLMLCKTLIARNGGELSVVSSKGTGSTFSVFLKAKELKLNAQ